jgi:hypothetical protein
MYDVLDNVPGIGILHGLLHMIGRRERGSSSCVCFRSQTFSDKEEDALKRNDKKVRSLFLKMGNKFLERLLCSLGELSTLVANWETFFFANRSRRVASVGFPHK